MQIKKEITFIAIIFGLLIIGALYFLPGAFAIQPTGANVNASNPMTAPNDSAGTNMAYAGNVTYLGIYGITTTQSWQGYFGNVTGVIQLADSNDNVMFNWTMANPGGEVYATSNSTVIWTYVQCLNFTANGSFGNFENNLGGVTNKAGVNLTYLESMYHINTTSVDGVDETFNWTDHDGFFTAAKEFTDNECKSTRVYGDTGASVDKEFEEVLLYEPSTVSIVYASLLEDNLGSFDRATYDFEMLVLEDGHGTDVASTRYYFFVELE